MIYQQPSHKVKWIGMVNTKTEKTKRRKTEALLPESVDTARLIFESLPLGMHMYRLEPDGRLVFTGANPAADRILGIDNSIFIGKTIEEAFPPLKDTDVPQRYRDVAVSGKTWETERIEYEDNTIKGAFELHAFRIAPNIVVAAFDDITTRKRADESLRIKEERYRNLFEQSPVSLWEEDITELKDYFATLRSSGITDLHAYFEEYPDELMKCVRMIRIIAVNRATLEIFDSPDEAALVQGLPQIFTAESYGAFREILVALFEGKGSYMCEAVNQTISGQKIDTLLRWSLLSESATQGSRALISIIDITNRKREEEALQESEERFELAMQGSNDGLWDWDMSTDEVYYSPRWKSMLGYAPDELEHKLDTWKRLMHPDDRNRTLNVVRSLLEGRSDKFEVEFRMQHKDGSFRHILSRAFLSHTAEGRHKRLVGTHVDITESKNVEQQLLESKKQLIQSQTVARIGHYVLDLRLGIWSSSEMLDELFGIGPEYSRSVEGWLNIVQPEQRQQLFEYYTNHVMRDKQPFDREYQIIRVSDNASLWVHGLGEIEYSEDGTPVQMFGTVQDITDRKRAEEALRASEKMLQTIIDAEPECVKLLDENAKLISMNRAGLYMIQADSLEQVHGQCICPLITSEYQQPFLDLTRRVFQGETGTLLFEVIGLKGRHLWLETHAVPLRNEKNEIFALLGLTRDITDRKRAEEDLRQSEQFIRSILDTVDEGFIVVDRDYRILTANKAYCRQVGQSCEKVIGQHCYEISHRTSKPCYEEGEECATRHAFETGSPHTALHRHTDAYGNILYVETKAFPLKDVSGAVTSVIEVINNITEKYLLEEERLKSQKLESIGTLAGGIAHDFNNLLQGIFGYISMAKLTHDKKEKSLSMLEQAEKALHMSVNLTTQLLTFSKGGKPLKKLIRLGPEIENAVKFALSGSKTDHRLEIVSGLWPVEADAGQLAQVIQNIVLNADEAMAGGGTVHISVSNRDKASKNSPLLPKGGRFVCIEIQDTGTGIPVQNLSKIFDPYFTTKQKGSGLGLATSYSIIRNHGGVIEVKSEQNRGTTFSICLPAAEGAEVESETSAFSAAVATKEGRILLMDDEDMVRNVAGEMIEALGHDVVGAEGGSKAIDLFLQAREAGSPFDLVILDLTVKGGMGGEEAIAKIRAIDPNVMAVVSSGYADNPVVADYRAYGFSGVLSKPYKLDALKDCLNLFFS